MAEYIEESLQETIGKIQRSLDNKAGVRDKFKKGIKNGKKRNALEISDEEYDEALDAYKIMKNTDNYHAYKKAFDKLCSLCKVNSKECVITNVIINKSKNGNIICLEYANADKSVSIPAGSSLYHISTHDDIDKLKPTFRSKNGYFYSSKRVYLTINPNMLSASADFASLKPSKYRVKETLSSAFVDPLLPLSQGAVYVNTDFSIPVEEVTDKEESVYDIMSDEVISEKMLDYIIDNDLELVEEGEKIEKMKEAIGKFQRKIADKETIKRIWKDACDKITTRKTEEKEFDDETTKNLKSLFEVMKKADGFHEYKKAFNAMCNILKINSDDSIIEYIYWDKGTNMCHWRYSTGSQKIVIPNGAVMIHISSQSGITSLKPTFRSKKEGHFFYPKPRVYFTINKDIPERKSGIPDEGRTKYTPKENIQVGYIDASWPQYKEGAVYVNTSFPIPVKTIS